MPKEGLYASFLHPKTKDLKFLSEEGIQDEGLAAQLKEAISAFEAAL